MPDGGLSAILPASLGRMTSPLQTGARWLHLAFLKHELSLCAMYWDGYMLSCFPNSGGLMT